VNVLNNHESIVLNTPLSKAPSIRLDTPQTKVAKQPHCSKHVKKNMKKRKRKLTIGDHVIANAITKFSDGIKEIIKRNGE
jgi:hypothetical protein